MARSKILYLTAIAALAVGCSERRELLIGLPLNTEENSNDAADGSEPVSYLISCGTGPEAPPSTPQGASARGKIPTGLSTRMGIGFQENSGGSWLQASGIGWDYRWAYFSPTSPGIDWFNDWGYGAADGSFATGYFNECDTQGFVPVIQYYNLSDDYEPAGDDTQTLAKIRNAAYMNDYFAKFKAFLEKAKAFGKPVVILLEGNVGGLLQQQSHGDSSAAAAIATSGVAELASLPDTVAGFGLAFLQLRKSVGADNVLLGFDVPFWATGDFISYNVADDIEPHVDAQYVFLASLGLSSNVTGQTYDFVANNPLGADFDWFRYDVADNGNQSQNVWWDPDDAAPVNTRSFNRYAQWLRLFNEAASLRWVLWQIPMGNSNSPNRDNPSGGTPAGTAAGWKDNRPEYFFCSESNRHLGQFADAGVIALLFGAGGKGCTDQTSDYYPDGQLFLKSHAGALVKSGGFPLTP